MVGVIGILLWIVTNVHLVRTGRSIKADIDAKREATEEFVQAELRSLRTDLSGTELKGEFDALRADFKVELQELESRLATVQLDAAPILADITATLIPAVEARVENVKKAILGKLGYAVQGVKALAEGAVELVGETAVEEAGFEAEWQMRLAQIGMDDDWLKTHKTAAFGLSLIKEAIGKGHEVQLVGSVPAGAKRVGPPKGFG